MKNNIMEQNSAKKAFKWVGGLALTTAVALPVYNLFNSSAEEECPEGTHPVKETVGFTVNKSGWSPETETVCEPDNAVQSTQTNRRMMPTEQETSEFTIWAPRQDR